MAHTHSLAFKVISHSTTLVVYIPVGIIEEKNILWK